MLFKLQLPPSLGSGKVNSAIAALVGSRPQATSNVRTSQIFHPASKPGRPYFGSVSMRRFEIVRSSPRHNEKPPYIIGRVSSTGRSVVVHYSVRLHWGISIVLIAICGYVIKSVVDAFLSPEPIVWGLFLVPAMSVLFIAHWCHVVFNEKKLFLAALTDELRRAEDA